MNYYLPIPMALSGTKRNLYDDLLLNCQRREIRVLVLCEGHDDSLVECSIKIMSLDNGAAYSDALSYVWDDTNETATIIVNQLPIPKASQNVCRVSGTIQHLTHKYSAKRP
jgi:hypothetical protein